MVTIRPGSHVYELLTILSYVGEFPMSSIHLLGSEHTWRKLISKLTQRQEFRFPDWDDRICCRMLSVSGRGKYRTIRLTKAALPILERVNPTGCRYYTQTYARYNLSSLEQQVDRNHRVSESVAMCLAAGMEACPYTLPELRKHAIQRVIPDTPCFYLSRELKAVEQDDIEKTMFSRVTGAIFYSHGVYAVYNSRDSVMKWHGKGECKFKASLETITSINTRMEHKPSAILFGSGYEMAASAIQSFQSVRKVEIAFDSVYPRIHFIPLNSFGARVLRILTVPDWYESILDLLFEPEDRSHNRGSFDYDAVENDVYMLSFLDGDIIRLNRFRESIGKNRCPAGVLCYPEQVRFLQNYLGSHVKVSTICIDVVEAALLPGKEES